VAFVYHVPHTELLPVAALFLKLNLIAYYNLARLHEVNVSYQKVGLPRTEIGLSLSLASSLINHSCDPNMYQVNYGSTRVYRAKRPIKKGEQLTESYHMLAASDKYFVRQVHIQKESKFCCR